MAYRTPAGFTSLQMKKNYIYAETEQTNQMEDGKKKLAGTEEDG